MVYHHFLCLDSHKNPERFKCIVINLNKWLLTNFPSNIGYKSFCFLLRFGHSQVNTHLWRFEEDGTMSHYGHIALRDAFFSPERVAREEGIDSLLRGAVKQVAQEVDLKVWSLISIHNYLLHICSLWIYHWGRLPVCFSSTYSLPFSVLTSYRSFFFN